jgi:hypothetical protein
MQAWDSGTARRGPHSCSVMEPLITLFSDKRGLLDLSTRRLFDTIGARRLVASDEACEGLKHVGAVVVDNLALNAVCRFANYTSVPLLQHLHLVRTLLSCYSSPLLTCEGVKSQSFSKPANLSSLLPMACSCTSPLTPLTPGSHLIKMIRFKPQLATVHNGWEGGPSYRVGRRPLLFLRTISLLDTALPDSCLC